MTPERFIYPSPGFQHYWTHGRGRKMIGKLAKLPSGEDILSDVPKLFEYDKLADSVVEELYFGVGFREATRLIDHALDHGITSVPEAPESLKALFNTLDTVPEWLNWEKLGVGVAFSNRTGIPGLIVLRDYCLMGGYESSAVNKPLIATGALKKGAAKRMSETTEFWVNATGKDALKREGIGFKATVKVRLLHAYSRLSILKSGEWNSSAWGVPINRWDMLATNLGFSLVFLKGLKDLGFYTTKEETEGIFHLWKYIGYLLGIPEEDLPDTESEAIEKLYRWTITQPPADKDTITLATALSNEPLQAFYLKTKWQRLFLRQLHLAYNYFFLGKRACSTMQIEKPKLPFYPYLLKGIIAFKEIFVSRSGLFYKQAIRTGYKSQVTVRDLLLSVPR